MTTSAHLHEGVTVVANDHPYQRVAFQAHRLTDAMRAAADWLDDAEKHLGENLFVAATLQDVDEDGWQFSVLVHVDEFEGATQPKLATG